LVVRTCTTSVVRRRHRQRGNPSAVVWAVVAAEAACLALLVTAVYWLVF
jgi:hypothetical protein